MPTPALYVEAALSIPLFLMGVSHLVQRRMWLAFFQELAAKGPTGVIWRTFMLELWPAVLIVCFHQVWSGPALLVTLYGHLLMAKIAVSVVFPAAGLHALNLADRAGPWAFAPAGVVLTGLSIVCFINARPILFGGA
ncbi:MAG: hypothetical protein AAGC56_03885 [Pseudomonadota bacterium]